MKEKLKVLHITPDDKFFDNVFKKWVECDLFINNALVIIDKKKGNQYIRTTTNVLFVSDSKAVKCQLLNGAYDIVLFYSLPPERYFYLSYVKKEAIVIWWAWGCDLYLSYRSLAPLLSMELYKPLTNKYILQNSFRKIFARLSYLLDYVGLHVKRNRALKRIDYFQPVTNIEYQLMNDIHYFHAKEFYSIDSYDPSDFCLLEKPTNGKILVGNSATPTNNHLDILNNIEKYKQKEQTVVMPLNYGDNDYLNWLKPQLQYKKDIQLLLDFIPLRDYNCLLDSCSYAVFGVIRQQAYGNIYYALKHGIKVFLYKESVLYKELKQLGFVVYAIEDMNADSFSVTLRKEEMEQNKQAAYKEHERRNKIYYDCLAEFNGLYENKQLSSNES